VASQDGLVSVWDVRSSAKIATLQTSQMSDVRGSGAARVVKWSPRGDLLAFSEHKNYIHIVETSTFTSSQRIKVPSGAAGQTRNAACNTDAGAREASATGADEVDVDDMLHSSTDTSTSASQGLLEATALNRFSTGVRNGSNSRPPWHGERRMRDFLSSGDLISGGSNIMRSPLDRALLGEWSSSRLARSRGAADDVEVYIDDRNPGARSAITNDTSTSMLARTVDNIMATFETESGLRNSAAGFWTSGGMPRRSHRSDDAIDISGLTWDPDGASPSISKEHLSLTLSFSYRRLSLRLDGGSHCPILCPGSAPVLR
jgi:WD40 repeat protein